jgi:hypothetical protein
MSKGIAAVVLAWAVAGCGHGSDGGGPTGGSGGAGSATALQSCAWYCYQVSDASDDCLCVRRYHFDFGCLDSTPTEGAARVGQCPTRTCCTVSFLDQSAYDQVAEMCLCSDRTAEECQADVAESVAAGETVRAVAACPAS